jgi:hypothetical protein
LKHLDIDNDTAAAMISYRWSTDIFYFATLTKPTEAIYTLHNLQGQLDGFQSRIAFLNLWRDESFLSFKGIIDQILGPRWDNDSVPHATVRTLKVWNIFSHGYFISGLVGKISRIIFGEIPYATFNVRTVAWGTESLSHLGPKIWSIIPLKLKKLSSLHKFKNAIRDWKPSNCPCRLCKVYIASVGFVNVAK